jgi:hypothetical protein
MTSSINPNNIDGAYPVAGQDNNSQGFRDNFTNTKTNFGYAANEITDLQNKAVLKAALTGTTLNNDMNGSILSNAQLQNMSGTVVSLGTLTGDVGINYTAGPYQTVTTSGSISLAFTNFTPAGTVDTVAVQVTISSTAHTLTLPAAVSVNNSGIQGINSTTNVIEFAATGTYTFVFTTSNGGTTITVTEANKALQPFNNSQQDLANGGAISLATTVSYFTTGGAETATLADGVEGQVKILVAQNVSLGSMTITVASPAWSGGGTITFSASARACTLTYIQGVWFCTGNNGAVFA